VASLDEILNLLAGEPAGELVLRTGDVPVLQTPAGARPLARAAIGDPQVVSLARSVADEATSHRLAARQAVRFTYRGFQVEVTFPPEGAAMRVRAAAAAPPPAASPPDAGVGGGGAAATSPSRHPIDALLVAMVQRGASDLHLSAGQRPLLRLDGEMVAMAQEAVSAAAVADLLWPIAPARSREEWERCHDTDFAYEVEGVARFRCNVFMDRMGIGAVFRQIPTRIPTPEQLGLPRQVLDFCWLAKGLVVVTGPTGSGKSTTLAALVDFINEHRADHIITIEDPIEFVHPNKRCLVNQREVGSHTESFKRALRAALREDPDIVLVGEMRDLETIAIALETAETGHLVFGTLHTTTAPSTVDRIIDQFPAEQQAQIRTMLSDSLKGVVAQTLCRKVGGGRVAAFEVLVVTTAIANLIREGKTFQIPSIMQSQQAAGNLLLNASLLDLVKRGIVEPREAYLKAVDKTSLVAAFERAGVKFDKPQEAPG